MTVSELYCCTRLCINMSIESCFLMKLEFVVYVVFVVLLVFILDVVDILLVSSFKRGFS